MKTLLSLAVLAIAAQAQTTVDLGSIDIPTTNHTTIDAWRRTQFVASAQTTLDGGINNSTTTVNVRDASGIAVNAQIIVGSEAMTVSGKSTNALTVTRGASGTTAASHSDLDVVKVCVWPNVLELLRTSIDDYLYRLLNQIALEAAVAPPPGDGYKQNRVFNN